MLAFGGMVIVFILYKRRPLIRVNAGLAYLLFAIITFLILLGLVSCILLVVIHYSKYTSH